MKQKIVYVAFVTLFLIGCQVEQNKLSSISEENREAFLQAPIQKGNYEFQNIRVTYILGKSKAEQKENKDFLWSQGLPPAIDLAFPTDPNWRKWDEKYQTFISMNKQNSHLMLYRQVVSIHILRNHALLADVNEKKKIAFYTKEYIESGGISAGLLFYCFTSLKGEWSDLEINSYIKLVIPRIEDAILDGRNHISGIKKNAGESAKAQKLMSFAATEFSKIFDEQDQYLSKLKKISDGND